MIGVLFLQAVTDAAPWAGLGVGGSLAAMMFWAYRKREVDYSQEKRADSERYSAIAQDFRKVVTENTAAMVALRDSLSAKRSQSA